MALPPNTSLDLPHEDERESIAATLQPLEWALTCDLNPQSRADTLRRVFFKYRRLFEISGLQYHHLKLRPVSELDPNDPLLTEPDPEIRWRVRAARAVYAKLRGEKMEKLDRSATAIVDRLRKLAYAATMLNRPVEFRAAMRAMLLGR